MLRCREILVSPGNEGFPDLLPQFALLKPFSRSLDHTERQIQLDTVGQQVPAQVPLVKIPLGKEQRSEIVNRFVAFIIKSERPTATGDP